MKNPQIVAIGCNTLAKIHDVARVVSCIEVDLMLTADKKLVVGHPSEFQAKELNLGDLESKYAIKPLIFSDLADLIKERNLFVFLDLKYEGMGRFVAMEIIRNSLKNNVVLISWSQQNLADSVFFVRRNNLQTGLIIEGALHDPEYYLKILGCSFFVASHYCLSDIFLEKLSNLSGVKLCVRKIENDDIALKMKRNGADYLFISSDSNYLRNMQQILCSSS